MKKSRFIFLLLICACLSYYWHIGCLPTLNKPPEAFFTCKQYPEGSFSKTVQFTAADLDPDGEIISYDWDFGDGAIGKDKITYHLYEEYGTYFVTLIVTDDNGDKDKYSEPIDVLPINEPPTAIIRADPTTGTVSDEEKLHVRFDGTESYDPDGSVKYYSWDYGDGDTDQKIRHSIIWHEYSLEDLQGQETKKFRANLVVEDFRGAPSAPDYVTITINREGIILLESISKD